MVWYRLSRFTYFGAHIKHAVICLRKIAQSKQNRLWLDPGKKKAKR